jgi:hypothetical protein
MIARVTLELDKTVPPGTQAILAEIPGIQVRANRPVSRLRVERTSVPLAIVSGRPWPLAQATASLMALSSGPGKLTLVVADRLPVHVRRELEKAGCAYADGTGAAHFDLPGLLLHIEGRSSRRSGTPTAGLGVVGVRAVQTLLTNPSHHWSVPDLSKASASSIGQAHRVFRILEQNGLVTVVGNGRKMRRHVDNPGDVLDWLSTVPAARRIREVLDVFMYSKDQSSLTTHVCKYAFDAQLVYAFTGSAAARIWGAGATTAIPVTMIRISPDTGLEIAAQKLHAEPVDRGANIRLVRDFGKLGTYGRVWNGPAAIAQKARVWLDMLGETRGEDAAALFRESAIGW